MATFPGDPADADYSVVLLSRGLFGFLFLLHFLAFLFPFRITRTLASVFRRLLSGALSPPSAQLCFLFLHVCFSFAWTEPATSG